MLRERKISIICGKGNIKLFNYYWKKKNKFKYSPTLIQSIGFSLFWFTDSVHSCIIGTQLFFVFYTFGVKQSNKFLMWQKKLNRHNIINKIRTSIWCQLATIYRHSCLSPTDIKAKNTRKPTKEVQRCVCLYCPTNIE